MIIYFWQNMVAMHQVHCLKNFAERHEVHWLVDEELGSDRVGQGWSRPDTGKIRLSTVKPAEVAGILGSAPRDALHVFAPRGCATGPMLLTELNRRGLRYAFIAEKPLNLGFRLWLRGWLYRSLAIKGRRHEFFLAMGETGADWYRNHGFSRARSFGYTVADAITAVIPPSPGPYRFLCAAQLISRKNHAVLLRALSTVSGEWTLECIGRGPLEDELMALSKSLGLADRVTWTRSLPNPGARERISRADTLVLSSAWEGWGAVVNEALAEGTRVVVSDVCGASCLLGLGDVGDAFPSGDAYALADRLRAQMARGRVEPAERMTRRALHGRVNGPAMAIYLEKIAAGENPTVPWNLS